jgi:GNAT superfamily N-acetyltransferase
MTIIRDPFPADENAWRRLWSGYLAFYGASVPDDVTAATWKRILDPAAPIFGRFALAKDSVVGFALGVLHAGTWVTQPICYLEDLFVDPESRGSGIGHALIADLMQMGRERGWSGVYWHTRASNPARKLYDRFVAADDFVRYRVTLPSSGNRRD